MATLPFAREDGFARHVGRPSNPRRVAIAIVASALLSVAMAGLAGVTAVVAVALSVSHWRDWRACQDRRANG
jgi:hypothetical protein